MKVSAVVIFTVAFMALVVFGILAVVYFTPIIVYILLGGFGVVTVYNFFNNK